MRLATFNLESLDLPPKAAVPLETRAQVLRPSLERLEADILCLQEVNGQHVAGREERALLALDQLLAGTRYAGYARLASTGPKGHGVADVHTGLPTSVRSMKSASTRMRPDPPAPPQRCAGPPLPPVARSRPSPEIVLAIKRMAPPLPPPPP